MPGFLCLLFPLRLLMSSLYVTSAAPAVSAVPIMSTKFAVSAGSVKLLCDCNMSSAASAVFDMSAVSSIYVTTAALAISAIYMLQYIFICNIYYVCCI
jgi:hypothetical protein